MKEGNEHPCKSLIYFCFPELLIKDRESMSRDNLKETRNKFKCRQPCTSVQQIITQTLQVEEQIIVTDRV